MGHKDTIITYVTQNNGFYCDDCLSKICSISSRQTVFQVATKMSINGEINRRLGTCSYCGKEKTVNSIIDYANKNNIGIGKIKQVKSDKNKEKIIETRREFISNSNKFIEVKLQFESFNIKDTFSRFNAHTLEEILTKDKYLKLKDECNRLYKNYMSLELGTFINMLKQGNNAFYKRFLNPYGDQLYCKFKMMDSNFERCKGLYMYKCNNQIKYIGRVKGNYNFYQRINAGYANISPKNCYIDGQATNCHINAIINKMGEQIRFYIMPLQDDEEICSLERELIEKNQPEWNIALK